MGNNEEIYHCNCEIEDENLIRQNSIIKLMYMIDRPQPTEFFINVRQMVGQALQQEMNRFKEAQWQKGAHWIKAEWTYPCFEHLTFAYKNQIFCVLIDIIDENSKKSFLPNRYKKNLIDNCIKNNLIPCLYKVSVKDPTNPIFNTIKPVSEGWNLYHAISNEKVIPEELVSNKKIEMSDWELYDFAIQVIRTYITNNLHCKVLSYQNVPEIDPQIWFEDTNHNECYVVVRYTIGSEKVEMPQDINSIQLSLPGYNGYFAGVGFKPDKYFDKKLYRGQGSNVYFDKLIEL